MTGPPDPHDKLNMEYFQSLRALRENLDVGQEMNFVYELGPNATEPLIIDMSLVSELLRVSDALFMPSYREGFGMPVLEAGLAGIQVFCANTVPAAREIGGQGVISFSPESNPDQVASLILKWAKHRSVLRLRQHVRRNLTWQDIFQRDIVPLMDRVAL